MPGPALLPKLSTAHYMDTRPRRGWVAAHHTAVLESLKNGARRELMASESQLDGARRASPKGWRSQAKAQLPALRSPCIAKASEGAPARCRRPRQCQAHP